MISFHALLEAPYQNTVSTVPNPKIPSFRTKMQPPRYQTLNTISDSGLPEKDVIRNAFTAGCPYVLLPYSLPETTISPCQ